jgi:hypothetical protein
MAAPTRRGGPPGLNNDCSCKASHDGCISSYVREASGLDAPIRLREFKLNDGYHSR